MKKKWQISRRRMLKGMGACIALPFLEAMALPGTSNSSLWKFSASNCVFVYAKWGSSGTLDTGEIRKRF
jgi:hypothetical protein